jgi:RNA polymerase sigma-70 factor (ECF subfamily)
MHLATSIPCMPAPAMHYGRVVPRLDDLFREHHAFLFRCMRRFGLPDAAAEDAVQEVYIIVQRRLSDYEERGSARAWLYRIAQGVASHYHRGEQRARARLEHVGPPRAAVPLDDELALAQAADAVEAFLAELDDDQETVFVLADIEGFTAPEIAAVVNAPVSTVYSRLRLARRKFESFAERYEKESTHGAA